MDSVIRAYYWAGLIDNVAIILIFVFMFLFIVLLFTTITPRICYVDLDEKKAFKKTSFIVAIWLALVATVLILLPSHQTQQTYIAAKMAALQNDNTLLPSERDMLLKHAATLQKKSNQEDGGQQ